MHPEMQNIRTFSVISLFSLLLDKNPSIKIPIKVVRTLNSAMMFEAKIGFSLNGLKLRRKASPTKDPKKFRDFCMGRSSFRKI